MNKKVWIWQSFDYPNFTYDYKILLPLIEKVSKRVGQLNVLSKIIESDKLENITLNSLEEEIISSSAIEGEFLDRDSVKSSIVNRLAKSSDNINLDKKASNYVDILIDANFNNANLTIDRVLKWHYKLFEDYNTKLFKIEVGKFRRNRVQVVSGVIGKEKVFYEAPSPDRLIMEIEQYIDWFNTQEPTLLKAAIAHLWFVIIHPFDDGNGRIARAITEMALSQMNEKRSLKLYSLSKAINSNKKAYYNALEATTGYIEKKNLLDITIWCDYFLNTMYSAVDSSIKTIDRVIYKANFWDNFKNYSLNSRQILAINMLLDKEINYISTKKYAKITKSSTATASRDIKKLLDLNILKQVEGTKGRNIKYILNFKNKGF